MYWKEWFQSIITLVILLGILESFLPKGELAKFSKLVFGLALMLALLQPLVILLNKDLNNIDWVWSDEYREDPALQVVTERLQVAAVKPFIEAEQQDLTNQIEGFLVNLDNLEAARVYFAKGDQNGLLINIFVRPFSPRTTVQVSEIVASFLNIPAKYVVVQELVE